MLKIKIRELLLLWESFLVAGLFYTGNIGLGVVNLLLWPASILWDPVSGSNGAKSDNYFATKSVVAKKQAAEISELDDKLRLKQINTAEYVKLKRDTEKKYSADY